MAFMFVSYIYTVTKNVTVLKHSYVDWSAHADLYT